MVRRTGLAVLCLAAISACGPPATNTVTEGLPKPVQKGSLVSEQELSAVVDSLLTGSFLARRTAADSLERLDDPRTPGILLGRLRTPAFRYEASRALSHLDMRAGTDSLISGLSDTSVFVRWSVARALGALGVTNAGAGLAGALDDSSMAVRRAAACSIGQLADTSFIPVLLAHAHDPHEEVRAAVAEALGEIGPETVPILQTMVEDDSGLVVTAAIEALGRLGGEETVPAIGIALLDSPIPTRMTASQALGRIGGPAADSLLLAAALDDPAPLVREAAVHALAHCQPRLVVGIVNDRRTREPDVFVRLAWVDALGQLRDEGARSALEELAEGDSSPDVRRAARAALLVGGDQDADGMR